MAFQLWARLCVFLLYGALSSVQAEKHSLYYIYTGLSKPVDLPGIYEFSAMGLLDDTQIDYYNSEEKRKIPKQQWMKENISEDYWEIGTKSRKSKEQWFNVNIINLMKRMRDDDSDVHVLQWRVGCEVEQQGDEVKFSKGISEYGYDGENFLSFDNRESQWVTSAKAALPTKRKWDSIHILNQYTKGYLEKECVDWLNKFRKYGDSSPPDVYVFAKKSIRDKSKLKLTCMVTGFYPKDVMLTMRKYRISLPECEIESTRIRPNHDGSFQMKKSVVIKEDEKADYDCFVTYKSIKEPIIVKWDGNCKDCQLETVSGLIGGLLGLIVFVALVFFTLKKKSYSIIGRESAGKTASSATGFQEDFNTMIPAENMVSVPGELLQILDELDSGNLKKFKWHLKQYGQIPSSLIENADNAGVVEKMLQMFGPNESLKLTVKLLKMMNQNHLAEHLEIKK
ncbi:H-2 class I histocompatibility antigen, Q10 alpha chain-like [Megalobrama amblycephala]|uniref:H-2 class I histocompatibility antigen, Q10 alpha chain-like n=1 Tax=Megalobrama amblycephala TaxID=75352 RepID=UPI0020145155|nr:H-2 class I histocompatibility antigen, Q10 alpha chain-like [Megalobrama amblycephala]